MLFKPTCAQMSPHLSLIFLHPPVLEKSEGTITFQVLRVLHREGTQRYLYLNPLLSHQQPGRQLKVILIVTSKT